MEVTDQAALDSSGCKWSRREIIRWWEQHRLRYNLIVGGTGIASMFLVLVIGGLAVKPGEDFVEPLALVFGPLFYAVAANICYTFGWLFDVTFYDGSAREGLFRVGLVFSAILTFLPGAWAIIAFLLNLHTGHKLP